MLTHAGKEMAFAHAYMVVAWNLIPRDPRHIYANPLQPNICPILALGLYWSRFRKCWLRLSAHEDVATELQRQGLNATELGTHSMRKGSATAHIFVTRLLATCTWVSVL
ncbi:uncharacterized protein PITG_12888 [Phytophthora infestans T30-4]|uniref:Uncharacterized protein n=1 Tax=Phytophthora infestans (strain T30-4) TaxID=403677 RepID=D0NLE3_PHYIT|nr:uncharacterized protein PITG_12888 [Phytophthora infestans T30-4]EEY60461.1 conserved hypothetical protein [Phytophthora infestans T30-4]|eukprot:XP_002900257.1 conserved hypothetical protein [Phytophthora infestans T30-4]